MTKIYHLALVEDWQNSVSQQATYYPPTYDADGFTHGTSDANRLLDVANHFYQSSSGQWLCLEMTEQSLGDEGVKVKFEPAANVGKQDGNLSSNDATEPMLFPHIYGGIHPRAISAIYPVIRDASGKFLDIDFNTSHE